jgi:hypothetical protein
MLLSEIQHIRANDGPVVVFARHRGRYSRPVTAYELDMRMEDNPDIPKVMLRIDATWIARHPTENYYIVYDGLDKSCRTRVSIRDIPEWRKQWAEARRVWQPAPSRFPGRTPTPIPEEIFELPTSGDTAWWEWVQAFDRSRRMIKAPKRARPGELSPEEVDEKGGETVDLSTRLDRIYSSR